ncbi:rRNA methyltransferase 1, mitochondrial [Cocos nucifera]|uniref:rRNA methyltransferase 1, mitochondrial n=1 Tax=Cocos nucifera TaxID=13894 RepID=A0A8K0NCP7_COCNU|nr:rRNA methyltransferase 1, mitochondrial [Cocos nucifera]
MFLLGALKNSARSNSQTLRSGSGKSARYLPEGFHQKILESSSGKKARSFSRGFHLKSLETIGGMRTRIFPSGFRVKTLDSRSFSDGFDLRAQKRIHGLGTKEVEEEDDEPIDDPRWDRIKNKPIGFIDRQSSFKKPEAHQWNKQEKWGRKTRKDATESSVPKIVGQGVYGVGPVLAALTAARREFYVLYVQEGLDLSKNKKKKDKKAVEKVLQIAEKMGLKVTEASKHDLNMVVDNRPHQGLVLDASPLEMVNIRELEPVSVEGQKAPLWVALDEVTDPQNLGAIIRSAYFFGAEGVVLCAKNSAPLSGVVSKASAGSLELIELLSCKNMMQLLLSSIENGWRVLGGSVSSRAIPLNEVEAGVPTILVLGSEGSGLRPLVERTCTELIRIPGFMPGWVGKLDAEKKDPTNSGQDLKSFLAVESLNVSVAAGVLLYHLIGNNGHVIGEKPNDAFM